MGGSGNAKNSALLLCISAPPYFVLFSILLYSFAPTVMLFYIYSL